MVMQNSGGEGSCVLQHEKYSQKVTKFLVSIQRVYSETCIDIYVYTHTCLGVCDCVEQGCNPFISVVWKELKNHVTGKYICWFLDLCS